MSLNRLGRRAGVMGVAAVAGLLAGGRAHAAAVLFDDFEVASHPTGDRLVVSGQALPIYTRTDAAGTTATIVSDTGAGGLGSKGLAVADVDANTGTSGLLIVPLATTISLASTNDTATLSFRFRYTNNGVGTTGGNQFRFGFEHSTGTPVTADNQGASDNDIGYYAAIGAGTATPPATNSIFWEETGGTGAALGGGDRTSITASGNTGTAINDNLVHTASLQLTRTASGVLLSLVIDGGTAITGTDTTTLRTTFDEIMFGGGFGSAGQAYILDDVNVVGTVPEPTGVAVVGMLGMGVLARRRLAR